MKGEEGERKGEEEKRGRGRRRGGEEGETRGGEGGDGAVGEGGGAVYIGKFRRNYRRNLIAVGAINFRR